MIKRAKRRSKWVINSQDNDKNFLAQRFMIVLLPVVLTLTNSHWLVNKNDIDVWFYFGYFKDFLAFSDSYSPDFAHTYYGTRLPFTLPGHLIFKLFGVSYGNFVLSVLFIYLLTVFSFYRILRLYVNRNVALLGTLLLTTDVYLWHAVGSDYVNTGVLIYSMLSILTLEAGARRRRPYLFVLSGFFLISAITTNLSFLFYLPFFVAIFLSLLKRFGKIFARTNYIYLFWMISGAFMCIIFYSIIFGFYTGQWQIFFLAQIETAKNVSIAGSFAQPFSFIFTQGLWVTVLFSALVSSFIALIVSLKVRTFRHFFNRDQKIFLATFFLFFLSFLLIAPVEFRYLMSRDGLYLPFILPMGYVALTIVCFGSNTVSQKFTLITGCLFFLLTWLHIGLRDGSGFASNHVEAWSLILISSLLILLSWLFRSWTKFQMIPALGFLALGSLSTMVNAPFDGNPSIQNANQIISQFTDQKVPKIFWDGSSNSNTDFSQIAASFTEKGWWQRGINFPACTQIDGGTLNSGDVVVVISRNGIDSSAENSFKSCVGLVIKERRATLYDGMGPYTLDIYRLLSTKGRILLKSSGADLASALGTVKGAARTVSEGKNNFGYVTYGPYLNLPIGKYRVELTYWSNSDGNIFDITSTSNSGKLKVLHEFSLPDSNSSFSVFSYDLNLKAETPRVEMRNFFMNRGTFKVLSLEIISLT